MVTRWALNIMVTSAADYHKKPEYRGIYLHVTD